jgi:hypothetical protein
LAIDDVLEQDGEIVAFRACRTLEVANHDVVVPVTGEDEPEIQGKAEVVIVELEQAVSVSPDGFHLAVQMLGTPRLRIEAQGGVQLHDDVVTYVFAVDETRKEAK